MNVSGRPGEVDRQRAVRGSATAGTGRPVATSAVTTRKAVQAVVRRRRSGAPMPSVSSVRRISAGSRARVRAAGRVAAEHVVLPLAARLRRRRARPSRALGRSLRSARCRRHRRFRWVNSRSRAIALRAGAAQRVDHRGVVAARERELASAGAVASSWNVCVVDLHEHDVRRRAAAVPRIEKRASIVCSSLRRSRCVA